MDTDPGISLREHVGFNLDSGLQGSEIPTRIQNVQSRSRDCDQETMYMNDGPIPPTPVYDELIADEDDIQQGWVMPSRL